MGLLSFLFGPNRKKRSVMPGYAKRETSADEQIPKGWELSERGNLTRLRHPYRITVFDADDGYKFCIAHLNDRDEPHFSDPYETQAIAIFEATEMIEGRPPRHKSLLDIKRAERDARQRVKELEAGREMLQIIETVKKEFKDIGNLESAKLTEIKKFISSANRCLKLLNIETNKRGLTRLLDDDETRCNEIHDEIKSFHIKAEHIAESRREQKHQPDE